MVEEYFGNPDTNKKLEIQAAFVAESESFFFLLKCNLILTDKRRIIIIKNPWRYSSEEPRPTEVVAAK